MKIIIAQVSYGRKAVISDHLVLPPLTAGLGGAARYARMMRSRALEILSADYVRTAHAKGQRKFRVILGTVIVTAFIVVVSSNYISSEYDLTPEQACCLWGAAVELKISEIVDAPNWIVSAYLPLAIFERPKAPRSRRVAQVWAKGGDRRSKKGRR